MPMYNTLYNLLPSYIRSKIDHSPALIKIINNIGWLFADRILRMAVGLIVGLWMARYLGPEQFGMLNYVIAFVALFSALSGMGLNSVVVRDLVNNPEDSNVTLGSAFILQIIGGLLAIIFALAVINIVRQDHMTKILVAIFCFTLLFKASEVAKYWFEAQVASKYTVWVENFTFLLFAAIKVTLILINASLITFIWAMLIETIIMSMSYFFIYKFRGGILKSWQPQIRRTKTLLKDSWPLLLSGIAIVLYMRIDQIMLGQIIGDKAVGIYSAAVRISEMAYFIPVIIVSSIAPTLIEAKKRSQKSYHKHLQKLYRLMIFVCLAVSIPTTFFSTTLIQWLYGIEYEPAGNVLAIHIWASIFVALGVTSSQPLLLDNLQRLSLYRTFIGCGFNIILNLLLIPLYGINGAALATVISYFIATFSIILFTDGRPIVLFMFKSIFNFAPRVNQ